MAYGFTRTLPTITGSHSDFPVLLTAGCFPTSAVDGEFHVNESVSELDSVLVNYSSLPDVTSGLLFNGTTEYATLSDEVTITGVGSVLFTGIIHATSKETLIGRAVDKSYLRINSATQVRLSRVADFATLTTTVPTIQTELLTTFGFRRDATNDVYWVFDGVETLLGNMSGDLTFNRFCQKNNTDYANVTLTTCEITVGAVKVQEHDFTTISSPILNGGGNLRAYTDDTKATQLPLEVVTFVTGGSPEVQVWVKATAVTGGTIYLEADSVATSQPAVTDTYGRNAVWVDGYRVYNEDKEDSTGNTTEALLSANQNTVSDLGSQVGSLAFSFDPSDWVGFSSTSKKLVYRDGSGSLFNLEYDRFYERFEFSYRGGFGSSVAVASTIIYTSDSDFDNPHLVQVSWNYLAGVTLRVHNGASSESTQSTTGTTNSYTKKASSFVGSSTDTTSFKSLIVRNIAVSQNYLDAEYDNQSDPVNWGTSSAWASGGGGGISITEQLKNTAYSVNNPAISFTGTVSVSEQLVASTYTALNPSIDLTGGILVTENLVNSNYSTLDPSIDLVGVIAIQEQLKNSTYSPNNPIVDLTSSVSITENLVNTSYTSNNPTISFVTYTSIDEQLVENQYNTNNPSILLTPEPLGIVSTVCFDGVMIDLSYNGKQSELVFNGNNNIIAFDGNVNELEFNGIIQTTCASGSIKTNC